MKIDGRIIADAMLSELSQEVAKHKEKGVTPTLAVILVGDDPGSLSYIKQKQKAAERIGARVVFSHQPAAISHQQLKSLIQNFNNDPNIHGLIVQRPVPKALGDVTNLLNEVKAEKDVDGFVPNSKFKVPVAAAVMTILKDVNTSVIPSPDASVGIEESLSLSELASAKRRSQRSLHFGRDDKNEGFLTKLRSQNIVIIGRGETAGKPIADLLTNQGREPHVIHSQTPNPQEIVKQADIIISCVGKPNTITNDMIKPGVVLISVGLSRDSQGKLHGDYEEDDIKDVASWYTPTPGGVGPINVACLMQNLITACSL